MVSMKSLLCIAILLAVLCIVNAQPPPPWDGGGYGAGRLRTQRDIEARIGGKYFMVEFRRLFKIYVHYYIIKFSHIVIVLYQPHIVLTTSYTFSYYIIALY